MKPYHLVICIVSNLSSELVHCIHFSNKSIGILSSHSNFCCQSSWISNFTSSNAGVTIPKGSKMELTQLSLLSSISLESDWTVIWSDFWSHTIPNVVSMGKLTKPRLVIFGEMPSFGKVFKISIELDVHFVKWNPLFFNNGDTDNMDATTVVKWLKESK